ncbi:cAMP-binding domain of CRP or a regulatory subunit of cAMP-dependent protein kinases [Niabella drilacis]|uniref:cAMP-binding domain of CRP or a regulatory subunit of cAMP-dependent protein kinases n=2 Tax=Niabella drilacis (strain DSM 25811 / CCM 8410 / CCUG 62505 / LMG 26954 / E90) TaxID=1285928 RepID=A0A1G7B4K8_NIADE|nr:cAMP-binding domain of CRP or a regulatory subunit of cAMP-dependent protein kinases [Niabella drilacis]
METQFLLENIKKHVALTPAEEEKLAEVCLVKQVKKKQFFLQEGEVQRHLVFVVEGCLRSYSVDENGFEHILQFAPPGWWISDMRSSLEQTPASLNIDAVDDSQVILINIGDLQRLYKEIAFLDRFFRILSERSIATHQHRLIDSLSLTAKQRYTSFCRQYPSLITCLPQKYVASYIGITPEFLSKMLKEPIKK